MPIEIVTHFKKIKFFQYIGTNVSFLRDVHDRPTFVFFPKCFMYL